MRRLFYIIKQGETFDAEKRKPRVFQTNSVPRGRRRRIHSTQTPAPDDGFSRLRIAPNVSLDEREGLPTASLEPMPPSTFHTEGVHPLPLRNQLGPSTNHTIRDPPTITTDVLVSGCPEVPRAHRRQTPRPRWINTNPNSRPNTVVAVDDSRLTLLL